MLSTDEIARRTGTSIEQAQARAARWQRHYEIMRPWLPEKCWAFLDVGCGLGGIAAWVSNHYDGFPGAHLLDGQAGADKWGGFRPGGKPWASVHFAADLFRLHTGGRACVPWWPEKVGEQGFGEHWFDLVYSTCSWGHHYPIATYLDPVRRAMPSGATLIVDLRLGEIGDEGALLLQDDFELLHGAICVGKKYRRAVWKRRQSLK